MSTLEFNSVTSVSDRDYFINDIELIVQNLYKGKSEDSYKNFLAKFISSSRLEDIESYLAFEKIEIKFLEDLRKPLEDLIKKLHDLEVIELRVAVDFKEKELREIGEQANTIIGRRVLMDVITDPSLIGGITLGYNGKFKDYSLVSEIEQVVDHAKQS